MCKNCQQKNWVSTLFLVSSFQEDAENFHTLKLILSWHKAILVGHTTSELITLVMFGKISLLFLLYH